MPHQPGHEGKAGLWTYSALPAAGGLFFLSSWILMIFAGIVSDEVGINPFGYGTALIFTIGLWMAIAPAVGAIVARRR
jgi:hypothetical protein